MTASDEPIDDERVLALIEIHRHPSGKPNETAIAKALGRSPNGIKRAIQRLAREGQLGTRPVLPGFGITQVSTQKRGGETVGESIQQRPIPESKLSIQDNFPNFSISRVTTYESSSGSTGVWTQAKPDKDNPLAVAEVLKAAFADFQPAAIPSPTPDLEFEDQLALWPFADPHFGSQVWRGDAGQSWDLKIAVKTFRETFAKVALRTPPTKTAILVVGGDTLHADSNKNVTPNSGNSLQVDGRHPKVFLAGCESIVEIAGILLTRHEHLEIIVLIGNHDETSACPIAFFLHAWFRNEPRVTVDTSAHMFRFRRFGKCMLGFTHGHTAKAKDMHTIMSHYEAKMWGDTEFRFAHTFHVHHKSQYISEHGGCVTESHQIMAPADAWHYSAGYKAARSQQSIVYDKNIGEIGRTRVSIC